MASLREGFKKINYGKFHNQGGGSGPYMKYSIIDFFEPFPKGRRQ